MGGSAGESAFLVYEKIQREQSKEYDHLVGLVGGRVYQSVMFSGL